MFRLFVHIPPPPEPLRSDYVFTGLYIIQRAVIKGLHWVFEDLDFKDMCKILQVLYDYG